MADEQRYNSPLTGAEVDRALYDMANHISERYAKGTAGGVPVTSGQVGYQDNSKYYAERAKEDADRAQSAVPVGTESAVLWTMAQDLTDSAKEVARTNIGAGNPLGTVAGGRNIVKRVCLNSANANFANLIIADCELKPNTTYTISFIPSISGRLYVNEYITNIIYWNVVANVRTNITFTTLSTLDKASSRWEPNLAGWRLIKTQNISGTMTCTDIQLEEGNTATAYEPYYPSNLQLTRKQNIVNLLECNAGSSSYAGVDYKVENGVITLNGQINTGEPYFVIDIGNFKTTQPTKLVGTPKGIVSGHLVALVDNAWTEYFQENGEGVIIPSGKNCFVKMIVGVQQYNNTQFKLMLTTNLDATYDDFIEYGHYAQEIVEDITSELTFHNLVDITGEISHKAYKYGKMILVSVVGGVTGAFNITVPAKYCPPSFMCVGTVNNIPFYLQGSNGWVYSDTAVENEQARGTLIWFTA